MGHKRGLDKMFPESGNRPESIVRASDVLAERENIPVGVFEPGYFVAGGGRPNAEFVLFKKTESLEGHASLLEPGNQFFDF